MTVNAQESLVPARAYVYLADLNTTAPADAEAELDEGWVNVGHTTPDSLSFSTEPEFAEVNSHQADQAIRRFQTAESVSVSVDLIQWNGANLKAAYGGGTVTEVGTTGSGQYKFSPPALGVRVEKSCIVKLVDGDKVYLFVFPKTMQIEGVQNEFQKGQEARLPLRLAVLGADTGDAWYCLSNDPALAPAPAGP